MKRTMTSMMVALVVLVGAAGAAGAETAKDGRPVIQLALLLDTSNSMDGLISQAKTELWKIVNEFATAKKKGKTPHLEVALYEYGKSSLPAKEGYIRMIVPLTTNLDKISEELFALTTNGGDEYCGQVIDRAFTELDWSKVAGDLKIIVIAGNEPFTQGPVDYKKAAKGAISKGIMINTIFCGPEQEGIQGMWKDGAVLADGRFMNIDQNQAVVHIAAPQDKKIAELNAKLNTTYVAYGKEGKKAASRQMAQDANASGVSAAVASERAVTKSSGFYKNAEWDLVDAAGDGTVDLESVEEEALPEEMRGLDKGKRKEFVEKKKKERETIQAEIRTLNDDRKKFVAVERKKMENSKGDSLDSALIKAVRSQAVEADFEFAE
ncbi:MAG: vWA domain-containing protein [Pseudomonadota bacterium]